MKRLGRGIASIIYPIGATAHPNPSGVIIRVNEDGSATVLSGTSEIGQGSDTVLRQIAAEALGVKYDDITLISNDTAVAPYDHGAGASRQTYIAGNAIRDAAQKVTDILFKIAGEELSLLSNDLESRMAGFSILNFQKREFLYLKSRKSHTQKKQDRYPSLMGIMTPRYQRLIL